MLSTLRALASSSRFALTSVTSNLLRSLLSLLGVTIGIFSIISIFTFVDSIEAEFQKNISKLGTNTLYVGKYPWLFQADYPWWLYVARPEGTYREAQLLSERLEEADVVGFSMSLPRQVVEGPNTSLENISVIAVSPDYMQFSTVDVEQGRFFTDMEAEKGQAVIVIGHDIASNLYGSPSSALGKILTMAGKKLSIVGVYEYEGESMIGPSADRRIILPYITALDMGFNQVEEYNPSIMIKGSQTHELADVENASYGAMRSIRTLHPKDEDNFAINKVTLILEVTKGIFTQVGFFGWIIAGFSILVGGFGIANIMFVSVKERTAIIGIQKALGARPWVILMQFLLEAVMLCVIGGIVAILLVLLGIQLVNLTADLNLVLTRGNVLLGVLTASIVGIISGILPAAAAARLNPIESIRSGL